MTFEHIGKRIDDYLNWIVYFLDTVNSYGCNIGLHKYVPFVSGSGYDVMGCFHPEESMENRCLFCYKADTEG